MREPGKAVAVQKPCVSPLICGPINMTNEALSVPWFDLKSFFNVTSSISVAKARVPGLGSFQPTLTTVFFWGQNGRYRTSFWSIQ
jgi:hypothetical protein